MRLLLATPLYPPEAGGPATYAKLLFEGLPKHGIEVVLVKFSDVRHLPKVIRHIAYFWRVYRAAREVDVVLVQDTISCGVPSVFAAKCAGKPLIVRVPGDYAWEQGRERFGVTEDLDAFQHVGAPWQVEVLRKLQSWVVRSADEVLVPSQYFASVVSKWGVRQEDIHVIYHGVRFPLETQAPTHAPAGPFIVSVGRLVPWKGFDSLIALLPLLPAWNLIIVGDGPEYGHLQEITKTNGVTDRVSFRGALPRAEALGLVAHADAFVLATTFESFSFQIVEALALGVAVITNAIGSLPELMTDKVEGLLLAPGDTISLRLAIESVTNEPEIWKVRKNAAKERAQKFSEERMLKETAAFLKSV